MFLVVQEIAFRADLCSGVVDELWPLYCSALGDFKGDIGESTQRLCGVAKCPCARKLWISFGLTLTDFFSLSMYQHKHKPYDTTNKNVANFLGSM